MKATGIVRRIDDLGRVVMPKKSGLSEKSTILSKKSLSPKTLFSRITMNTAS